MAVSPAPGAGDRLAADASGKADLDSQLHFQFPGDARSRDWTRAFRLAVGMPSVPAVGLFGGGVTSHLPQIPLLNVAILAGLGWFPWRMRDERRWLIATVIVMIVYALLAFTSAAENLVTAGGVLFEIGGAVACFYWVLTAPPSVGLERPLYALWG